MLEHDAKVLLAELGVPVPQGVLCETAAETPPFPLPCVVKAQVPIGGRGKAGGIRRVENKAQLTEALSSLLGTTLKGHRVASCRLEEAVSGYAEAYISLSVNPLDATITVLMSAEGGVDVESETAALLRADADPAAIRPTVETLAQRLPEPAQSALRSLGLFLADALPALDALLIEINPVFIRPDGTWLAGDAKLIVDDNALTRRPRLLQLLEERATAYPDAVLKLRHGFDFVVLDPDGEIGLVTTGAGLSMMLIDEMSARSLRPFNFCDIRTGQMRGDPKRLIEVLGWIAAGPKIRAVLVNIFAGITDLREFARLLIAATEAVRLEVPIVARLVGNGADEAHAILRTAGLPLLLEPDLDRAVAAVARLAREPAHA